MNNKRFRIIITILVIAVIVIAIPVTLYLVKRYQNLKSQAAGVGSVRILLCLPSGTSCLPPTTHVTAKAGDTFDLQLKINVIAHDLTGVNIYLAYETTVLALAGPVTNSSGFTPSVPGFTLLPRDNDNVSAATRLILIKIPPTAGTLPAATSGLVTLGTLHFKVLPTITASGTYPIRFNPEPQLVAADQENKLDLDATNSVDALVNVTAPAPTPVAGCVCQTQTDNLCSSACVFSPMSSQALGAGVIENTPNLKCSLSTIISPNPTGPQRDDWCNKNGTRQLRTRGDANADGRVDEDDYLYQLRASHNLPLPGSVNPDFDGDGVVSNNDLTVWQLEPNKTVR